MDTTKIVEVVKLKETDWDHPGGAMPVDVEYPAALVVEFVNWIRRTSAWLENPDIVERRLRKLNAVLMDVRNARVKKKLTPQEQRLANLAKGRAVQAAKRAEKRAAPQPA